MDTSSSSKDGRCCLTSATASAPVPPSPTTSNRPDSRSRALTRARTSAASSTRTTVGSSLVTQPTYLVALRGPLRGRCGGLHRLLRAAGSDQVGFVVPRGVGSAGLDGAADYRRQDGPGHDGADA